MSTYIDDLENRILNLEYQQLKKLVAPLRKPQSAQARSAAAEVDGSVNVRRERGGTKHFWKTASGVTPLVGDRSKWPARAREMVDLTEKAYARRVGRHGYMVSAPCSEPVEYS